MRDPNFKFDIVNRVQNGLGEGILDIPHPVILRYKSPEDLIKEFKESWENKKTQVKLQAVVLPVVAPDGLLYDCEDLGLPNSQYASAAGKFPGFQETVRKFGEEGINIYLSFDPTLQFIAIDALHIVDISGDSSSQVCIGNERTQELMGAILGMGIDSVNNLLQDAPGKLLGAVADVVDLWPMGAEKERIELTCFCESCRKFFDEKESELLKQFRRFPTPWNLVLKDSGTGISNINKIRKRMDAQEIVGLSIQKGYHQVFKEESEQELITRAKHLLRYMELRHNQTVDSLHKIFGHAFKGLPDPQLKRILLTEGEYYNWTTGLYLERLDETRRQAENVVINKKAFDEIWFNCTSSSLYFQNAPFRSYMWRRSRYLIDALFHTAATAASPRKRAVVGIARYTKDQVKALLQKRLRTAIAARENELMSIAALPDLKSNGSTREGFVGVAFDLDIGEKFIREIDVPEGVESAEGGSEKGDHKEQFMGLLRLLNQQAKGGEEKGE